MKKWIQKHPYLFFLLPGVILYGLFMIYPLVSALGYSFFSWDGFIRKEFIGFENFRKVLREYPYKEKFWKALGHNAKFFLTTFILQTTIGLYIAIQLNKEKPVMEFFQAVYFLTYTLSMVVVGFLWLLLLNPNWGAVSQFLSLIGLEKWVAPWLGQESTALNTIILINFWRWFGYPVLVFKAGLQSIPQELNEAAIVDGANKWHLFRYITLPLLKPTIIMVTILTFIWDFNAFELVFVMQGSSGNPHYSTDLLATFFYRTAFGDPTTGAAGGNIGVASAIAVVMLIIIGFASYFGIRIMQKSEIEY
ncbi:MAG TPA: sugar ABC transporter permease [Defluviitoga sp.]|nr:sugar ABC transporter permease [Defluviitoga sp.]HOP24074.1 sugar ABC transporter permease [Defluviitoga sp.]HPZ28592.1 sugar ABC transporter permease [Defluviitoga sp.]